MLNEIVRFPKFQFVEKIFFNPSYRKKLGQILAHKLSSKPKESETPHNSFAHHSQIELFVKKYGVPFKVIRDRPLWMNKPQERQVLAKVLLAPVTLQDMKFIDGTSPMKSDLPFVPGNEAVMEVVKTGDEVKTLNVGDRVYPKMKGMGTWRYAMVADEDHFIKIPSYVDTLTASMIPLYPCTAYRLLTDFVDLKAGDVVIQNNPSSPVGQSVIQIAAAKGIHTINVVKESFLLREIHRHLVALGSTRIVTYRELRSPNNQVLHGLPKPNLALNGFGGKFGASLLKHLAKGSTMVTYGGTQKMTFGPGPLIYKDLRLRWFCMMAWNQRHSKDPSRIKMLDYLFNLSKEKKFEFSHDLIPSEYYRAALFRSQVIKKNRSLQIIDFDYKDQLITS